MSQLFLSVSPSPGAQALAVLVVLALLGLIWVAEELLHPFLWGRAPDRPTHRSQRMRLGFRVCTVMMFLVAVVAIVASPSEAVIGSLLGATAIVAFVINIWANHE